jgi:type IV pilus assembly protein PilX
MMQHTNRSPLMQPTRSQHPLRQRGVALIISLIMLVLMTLVGMAGIRVINAEERIVSQTYDRAVTFQTAEATLREIEARIETVGQPTPAASSSCVVTGSAPNDLNICGNIANGTPRWISSSFNEWRDATAISHTTGISITPQYFVEYLGNNFPCSLDSATASSCKRYRITARAEGGDGRASVMLQSIYATSVASGTSSTPPSGP